MHEAPEQRDDDAIRVPVLPAQGAIVVEAVVSGPAGARKLRLMLDTGATLSMLSEEAARALGLQPSVMSARIATVNGPTEQRLAVVDRIRLGTARVDDLNVALCTRCSWGHSDGVIGLDVLRRFRMTVDHQRGELLLAPQRQASESCDAQAVVEARDARLVHDGDALTVELELRNLSRQALAGIELEVPLGTSSATSLRTTVDRLGPQQRRRVRFSQRLPAVAGDSASELIVRRACWASRSH